MKLNMKMKLSSSSMQQFIAVFVVNLGCFTTGISLSWPSPILVKLKNPEEGPLYNVITDDEASWMVALGFFFASFTNIFASMLLNSIGRKYTLLLTSLLKFMMAVFLLYATEVWMLISIRTIMLIFDCYTFVIIPIYASEITCKEQRDSLGSFLQIFSTLGSVVTLSLGPFVSYKTFNIIFTISMAITTVPLLFIPDSPFSLYSKGEITKATSVLVTLRGSELLAKQEIEEYKTKEIGYYENKKCVTYFKDVEFLKCLAFALILVTASQLIGFNATLYYLQTIFESTNTNVKSEIASIIIALIQVTAACCTSGFVNKFGRKIIIFSTLSGYFLGMVGLAFFFYQREQENYQMTTFLNYLPLISITLIIFCYSAGIGTLIWPVIAAAFDSPARAFGVSFVYSVCNMLIFLTCKFTPIVTIAFGPVVTYTFFAIMAALSIVIFRVPFFLKKLCKE